MTLNIPTDGSPEEKRRFADEWRESASRDYDRQPTTFHREAIELCERLSDGEFVDFADRLVDQATHEIRELLDDEHKLHVAVAEALLRGAADSQEGAS